MHVNEIAHYLWKSFNLNLLLNIQVLWRASVSMNNCDVLIFLRISCFLMRCLWVNLIFQMSTLLTSSCWKKGSHWDDRGKRRKNKEKRFKRLKKVHQRRKFVPFVNFLSFFESPSSINITNVNWIMYCWSLHPIWKCTCQLESYWI